MGLASFFPWFPSASGSNETSLLNRLRPEQWQILADARQKRIALVLFDSRENREQGFQSLILKLNQKENALYIDEPYPGLPTRYKELPKTLVATLKYPGSFQHWELQGTLIEKARANDGPYYKFRVETMSFRNDRRVQTRFNLNDHDSAITCTPAMEPPVYGDIDNISLGGVCFKARGNLQESESFALAVQTHKTQIPIELQLNNRDKLSMKIEVLSLNVAKKPYLHTQVRARFSDISEQQRHVLAALTQRSDVTESI
ncbi:MAG: PilZ domain-containing protein [Marinagarivorans sp.]|nr:PilZ domain-containing protein [Marinagarivorans sp.]